MELIRQTEHWWLRDWKLAAEHPFVAALNAISIYRQIHGKAPERILLVPKYYKLLSSWRPGKLASVEVADLPAGCVAMLIDDEEDIKMRI